MKPLDQHVSDALETRPPLWHWATCALNSCRERVLADEYDEHAVIHYDRSELLDAARDYIRLRNLVIERLNPRDDDADEGLIIYAWLEHAIVFIEQQPCACTPEQVEDYDPCERCSVLGRLGDKALDR